MRGKGRANAFDLFSTAIQNSQANEVALLLLDSEEAVATDHGVWQHLNIRDNFDKPDKATEEHVYLMVQVMETWLLADPQALRAYFGSKFKANKIPVWENLEAQAKQNIFKVLDEATAECGEKRYAKGKISFELLGSINPQRVADKCPHAKRLLTFLAQPR